MVRTKSTPRRSRRLWARRINPKGKKIIVKERLETPKTVSFRGKMFIVRYKRVARRQLKKNQQSKI